MSASNAQQRLASKDNTSVQGTPGSGNNMAIKSQVGNQSFKPEEISAEVKHDLLNAKRCAFDRILQYFLYKVLDSNSPEKAKLDELQTEIEQIQAGRYYTQEGDDSNPTNESQAAGNSNARNDPTTSSSASPAPVTKPIVKVIQPEETERKHKLDPEKDDVRKPREKELVESRRKIMDRLLSTAVDKVLPIANDNSIRSLQIELEKAFRNGHESKRYGPYVEMCNAIFAKLADLNIPGFRERSDLDIRFQVLDPSVIKSSFEAADIDVLRKPDAGGLSKAAFDMICKLARENPISALAAPPGEFLKWWLILLSQEFKVSGATKPHGLMNGSLKNHKYEPTANAQEESADKLPQLDVAMPVAAEETGEVVQGSTGSKRTSTAAGLGTGDGARAVKKKSPQVSATGSKSNPPGSQDIPIQDKPSKKTIEGRVQCASYALEMMSYNAGVQHVINLLFTDAFLWIWYYDRQGIIQSSGISIFEDFPRFIVLLFAFQRFTLEDWGIVTGLNPKAVKAHSMDVTVSAEEVVPKRESKSKGKGKKKAADVAEDEPMDEDPKAEKKVDPLDLVDVDLNEHLENVKNLSGKWKGQDEGGAVDLSRVRLEMQDYLSNQPHCLAGRATAVVPATGYIEGSAKGEKMVCKLYHPEVRRVNEGVTMEVIYKVAEDDAKKAQTDPERSNLCIKSMFNHLPKVYFYGDVKGTTTHRVRSMLDLNWKGHRVMRMIGMKKLEKLTILKEWEFVKAWLEGVICHEFLWKNYIEHGDPSLSNLMYDPVKKCGVLTDFDLSLLQWEPRVFGTDRTGTVPFMAVDILTKHYWDGWVKRHYYHELESFVWILLYTFLLYQNGKRQPNAYVDGWRTSSYEVCREKKNNFWDDDVLQSAAEQVQPDFADCWDLAENLCTKIRTHFTTIDGRRGDVRRGAKRVVKERQRALEDSPAKRSPGGRTIFIESPVQIRKDSQALWNLVYQCLKVEVGQRFEPLLACFQYFKPSFKLSLEEAKRLRTDLGLLYPDGNRPADLPNWLSESNDTIAIRLDSNGKIIFQMIIPAQEDQKGKGRQEDDVFT